MDSIIKMFKGGNKMETEVRELLVKQISSQLEELDKLDVGSNEYKTTVDGISKLLDKLNESTKNDYDYWNAQASRELEKELKEAQMKQENDMKEKQLTEDRKDHLIKNGLTAAGIISTAVLAVWGTYTSFKFEEKGTITTIMGRGFINNLIPKKHN